VAEGAILAGAAAYCLNPITGLGVGNAMKMGEMAGHQAIACFQQQAYTRAHLMLYDKQVRELYKNTGQIDRVINKFLSATVRILP
jgi:flavin-dependent dehydrogenase